ncbi:MAG: DUF4388 domain-containing protein [Nitrospirae bacterium]|nr:DUF4388 domain-containing protein [Nitrospirota bacterium]
MSIILSGKISFTPLVDVLEQLRRRKATGTLTVSSGDVKKCIFIKNGQIVFATSTSSEDRLGEILVKTGKLTPENLKYATQLYKKNAGLKKLGAILVENGLIASKDLFGGLKDQVKDIIFSLILLAEGDYQFADSYPADIIQLQFNFQELIAEIIQRIKQEA